MMTYRALAAASPSNDCNSLASGELEIDILENLRTLWVVLDGNVSELNLATPRPLFWNGHRFIICVPFRVSVLVWPFLRLYK